jgi:REP element-mobilizing transposase RayT
MVILSDQLGLGLPFTGDRPMSSTYLSLHYHIVFSTKDRQPIIASLWRDRLHEYLGGTVHGLGGVPEAVGGVDDHVHLLVGLRATHTFSDFVRELKKAGTGWVRDEIREPAFAWQEGYGAFTVSPTARKTVTGYIQNQAVHHGRQSFQEEFVQLLDKAEIEYDPKYLW